MRATETGSASTAGSVGRRRRLGLRAVADLRAREPSPGAACVLEHVGHIRGQCHYDLFFASLDNQDSCNPYFSLISVAKSTFFSRIFTM